MRLLNCAISWLTTAAVIFAADANLSSPSSSTQKLPSSFKPPEVFKNVNLLRNVNLEKGYIKDSINVVIENTDKEAHQEYYFPFHVDTLSQVGGFEARDKKEPSAAPFKSEVVEYNPTSTVQFYRITLSKPLAPAAQQTLAISYHMISSLKPVPATIGQSDKQYLRYSFSTYCPSIYPTQNQKTKIKFPGSDIQDYTGEPERQGSTFTYGPYENIPPSTESAATVRYEFTKPLIHASLLERDIEVSHWGGNVAFEERYWLTNKGAALANQFSRVTWAASQYYNPPTVAIKELKVPLKVGSLDPYFTDEIGNVSTSRFRSNSREALLELKPRYPVFGGWSFPFRIGWGADAKNFLRSSKAGKYVLKVPFLEGPKMAEGMSYETVNVRVILPEGAVNVEYETTVPLVTIATSTHKTFMDTIGRTTLTLSAVNVIDELRDKDLFVTYDYPFTAGLRKPVTIFAGVLTVFVAAWVVGNLDVSIGKKAAR